MDGQTLSAAMSGTLSLARYEQLAPAFSAALDAAGCTTIDRVAMWCAQIGHESAGLKYMEEIASGAAYEGRRDLGNLQPGDGRRYKGRGPIQVTGRANYASLSRWAFSRGLVPTATFFVDQPVQLASDAYGFLGAVWYWTSARAMNRYADACDIEGATRAVNGGLNGLADRRQRWERCRAMGATLLTPAGCSPAGRPTLRRGSRSDDVTLLQRYLRLPADGIFGPATEEAVKAFQRLRGLADDGIVGPATWKAMSL